MSTYTSNYIATPTTSSTSITNGSVQIWTSATTLELSELPNGYMALPTMLGVIRRFLEYDDKELLVEELVGKKDQPYVKITDDDLYMTIMFEEINEKFYLCLFAGKESIDMPERMQAVQLEDLLHKEDSFNIETCQLLSRLKMFESVFA